MSASYQSVLWNKFKRQYDVILWVVIIFYLMLFIGITILKYPAQNINTTLIRAFGTLAILLLHVILVIGPLSRISFKFLPILYNRRHLGVSMFLIALVHSLLSLLHFHGNGNMHPLLSLFTSNLHYNSLVFFPFQTLGFFALLILAVMAFTSHDFWLNYLSPKFWKMMHMLVYVAYGLLLLHVALGIVQLEKSALLVSLLVVGFISVAGLHLWAAFKERRQDKKLNECLDEHWIYVCKLEEIEEDKAKLVNVLNERVAIFKYAGKLSAVHNVCKHQMGPLGEGKVIDGCVTCPWHGYQYRPQDGCAPAPFTERVATYRLKLTGNSVYVNSRALPEGTFVEPLVINEPIAKPTQSLFFIGWANNIPDLFTVPRMVAALGALLIIITGIVLSNSQQQLSGFVIDYNQVKKVEGWLSVKPVPNLRIVNGKDKYGNPIFTTILLMDAFKSGADTLVKRVLNGDSVKYVRLSGYLSSNVVGCGDSTKDCGQLCSQCIIGTTNNPVMEIENGRYSFEIAQPLVEPSLTDAMPVEQTLHGEIIDPKCYFGAMNPGQGKPHLSCAARCISGGIMPVLKYQVNNQNRYAVLVGMNGEPVNAEVLNFVGVPVDIKGALSSIDGWGVYKIDAKKNIHLSAHF